MHLHGQSFDVVAVNGRFVNPATKDTLAIDPMGSADLVFSASNPGKWLFHCHNFEHRLKGLATGHQHQLGAEHTAKPCTTPSSCHPDAGRRRGRLFDRLDQW